MEHLLLNRVTSNIINEYKHINPLWSLMKRYPNKKWHFYYLSTNRFLTLEIYRQSELFRKERSCWYYLSRNPNIVSDEIVRKILNNEEVDDIYEHIDWYGVSFNPSITWDTIMMMLSSDISKNKIDMRGISRNPHILEGKTIDYISQYIEIQLWGLVNNPNITWEIIENYLDRNYYDNIEIIPLIKHPLLTWDRFMTYFFDRFEDYQYYELALNPNITFDIVNTYPHFIEHKFCLSQNPNVFDIDIISIILSDPTNIPSNIELYLCWRGLSQNPLVTMEMIKYNLHCPWDFKNISRNPNITLEFIEEYDNKLSFNEISCNKFLLY